jgi:predicted flap endonuclease-1-like 5' DNA nuclease
LAAGDVRAPVVAPPVQRRDDLERIDGVGPVYEQKLFDAGIETYAQLAAASEEQLAEVIAPQSWQQVDFAAWISQARQFAEVVLEEMLPYRLEAIRGIGPVYVKRLNAAGIRTFADLAAADEEVLRDIIRPASWQNVDFAGWRAEAQQFAALVAGDRPPLPLEQIKGIGPVFAAKLDMAGVRTFDDLSRLSQEQLREIIGARGWRAVNYEGWIAQARALAAEAALAGPPAEGR